MSTKRSRKKTPTRVVTADEQRALEQQRSLRRSVRLQRQNRALVKTLDRQQHRAAIDLMDLVTVVAKRNGYNLVRDAAGE